MSVDSSIEPEISYVHKHKSRCIAYMKAIHKTILCSFIMFMSVAAIAVLLVLFVIYVWYLFNGYLLDNKIIWIVNSIRTTRDEIIVDWMLIELFGSALLFLIGSITCCCVSLSCETVANEMKQFDVEMGIYNK